MKPLIITLTGPSCAGKSTLEGYLQTAGFSPAISTTTRNPRAGDVDGKNYHFVNLTAFEVMDEAGEFVESVEFGGNRYGLTAEEVRRISGLGRPVVAVVEPNGRDQIKKYCKNNDWNCVSVYIDNPPEVIATRFLERFIKDLTPPCNGDRFQITERNAQRIATMMTVERKWVNEASWSITPYDLMFNEFNEKNASHVVAQVIIQAVSYGYFHPTVKKLECAA